MNKKIEEYIAKEEAVNKIKNEIGKIIDGFFKSLSQIDKEKLFDESIPSNSKPIMQIMSQAYKFHSNEEYEKALPLFIEVSSYGNGEACYMVGNYYYNGLGVEMSYEKAFEYYELGAKYGHNDSRYRVGYMSFFGEGTPMNVDKGLEEMENAAFLGSEDAIYMLSEIYEKGICVERDDEVADYWKSKIDGVGEA